MKDVHTYAVISTPRVGSSMLCQHLEATNKLGWPVEWFNPLYIQAYLRAHGTSRFVFGEYMDLLLRGTMSKTNIFGVNFHVNHYIYWKNEGLDLLKLNFDKIYWVERKDKVKQAYSLAKATKTDAWSKEAEQQQPKTEDLDISPPDVAGHLAYICKECAYFEEHLKPLVHRSFIYETFTQDSATEAVKDILNDFSLTYTDIKDFRPMKKQANAQDEENIAHIKQYFTGDIGG